MTDTPDRSETLERIAQLRRRITELEQRANLDARSALDASNSGDREGMRAFQLVAEYATDLISIHADNGDYLFVSPNCRDFFGWQQDELLGRNAYELFHPDDFDRIAKDHADHETGKQGRVRYRIRHRDGQYRWVETRSKARRTDEGVQEIVALTSDIHDQVVAERFRREADDAKIKAATQSSVARLARATAHEINNPLQVGIGAAEMLPGDDELVAPVRRSLERIENVVAELNLLVERGDSSIQPIPLDEVLEHLCDLLAGEDDEVRLRVDSCRITTEVGRLHQLLYLVLSHHLQAPEDKSLPSTTIECQRIEDRTRLDVTGGREDIASRVQSDLLSALRDAEDLGGESLALIRRLAGELEGSADWEVTDEGLHTRIELSESSRESTCEGE